MKLSQYLSAIGLVTLSLADISSAQTPHVAPPPHNNYSKPAAPAAPPAKPKLVVLLVVDQMRADYVDKFKGQWTGGLKRLIQEGAWFHEAAYPYAATETCVGHATISTGALPSMHGVIGNTWWDRESQKLVSCTSDPTVKNIAYGGGTVSGGDSAWRMRLPAFAEELRFQSGGTTRVVTFSLKARAAITMAGHKADAVTWFDRGSWESSTAYGSVPFIEEFVKTHPMKADYKKSWELALPKSAYFYDEKAFGTNPAEGWGSTFPHVLSGKAGGDQPDTAFYDQWEMSPFADTYLTRLAETALDQLGLGKGNGTDFLAIGYSSPDHVGHAYGPRSWEIQDVLIRLDKDLAELFAHLDAKVGRGNYVVALSADHGVAPVPEDMQRMGADAGRIRIPELQDKIENALEPFGYTKPSVARFANADVYFSPGIYDKLKADPTAMRAVLDAVRSVDGVAEVYRAEDLQSQSETLDPIRIAGANSYFEGRSGDLFIVPRPYWTVTPSRKPPLGSGTGHGSPYSYDQRVALFLMGGGIERGEYFAPTTPADIATTFATLCGITLATHEGRVLAEALKKPSGPAPKDAD